MGCSQRSLWYAVLFLGLSLALFFCWWRLTTIPGINGDEAWPATQVSSLFTGDGSWRTPSGRFLSPLYLFSSAVAQWLSPGSVGALRWPAAFGGSLLIVLACLVFSRTLPPPASYFAMLLTAALPLHLAYARIGWEPCHTPLFALGALYFAWTRRWRAVWVTALASLVVHTTNLFLFPFLFLPRCREWRRENPGVSWRRFPQPFDVLGTVALAVLLITQSSSAGITGVAPWTLLHNGIRLLHGGAVFTYFIGTPSSVFLIVADLTTIALLLLAARGIKRCGEARYVDFAWGYLASLVTAWLLGGRAIFAAGTSRYALWLGVPTVFLVAKGWATNATIARRPWWGALPAFALLAIFGHYYFVHAMEGTEPLHQIYRSGPQDPKVAAFEFLRESLPPGSDVYVEDWWGYWTFAYLDGQPGRFRLHGVLTPADENLVRTFPPSDAAALAGIAGGKWEKAMDEARSALWTRHAFPMFGGRDAFVLWTRTGVTRN